MYWELWLSQVTATAALQCMLVHNKGASSSFEDQWASLNGLAPVDLSAANGPQQTEVAEELCKTASSGQGGQLHSFGHDMPLLPSKSRTLRKHTENKENIEGGLDGRTDQGSHSHSGTAHTISQWLAAPSHCSSDTPGPAHPGTSNTLQRRQARRVVSTMLGVDGRSGCSPALPRKQQPRDKSPGSLLEDTQDTGTFTRDRKAGFFSSFMKKKSSPSSSTSSSSSQLQQIIPTPPKRSSSFREMETQPHKKYEPTAAFSAPPPLPQPDILGGFSASPSHSHGEPAQTQSRCCGATFGQKPSSGGSGSQVANSGGSSWGSLAGFFTPRLIKRTLGLRTGKSTCSEEVVGGPKPFPRSNSTSSMSAGLPDLERMALTLPRNRTAKPPLERTSSTTSQPENGAARPSETLLRRLDEGTAQIRERPKAKLLPRGISGGLRGPGVGGESGESDTLSRVREEGGGVQDRQQTWSSPSKTSGSGVSSMAAGAPPHNHKVPVLISPTLKHSPADVHLVGVDSQGNRFKLLTDHQAERDRPRLVKPKCAPPPPPTLRSVSHSYSGDGEEQMGGAPPAELNGDATLKENRFIKCQCGR
ncbi:Tyrosine-protein kinase ABL2 [Merluccius polli]|uniref:Tyrosine-protein kinase ABL2 n=1 Tax=Merluccius polli TaxID=89951 RepID=A0AA47NBI2_MERPO|nr:Tyrosine-protein kinase ABL2 [Merluccius polli]